MPPQTGIPASDALNVDSWSCQSQNGDPSLAADNDELSKDGESIERPPFKAQAAELAYVDPIALDMINSVPASQRPGS